ncbi:histidine kinase [Mobilisporobacter senegalensis]|uniref:Histidine kinase n=1 Tax=Mobilisporobacter senegalensis TaxID=1329262 RepID=A0A3N1XNL1_9FIRM|nr:histidine kinase [Mobilisporobacter senegalensis]ROR28236.1 histidine kinase [Mobilisporobacter senegalensis]
MKKNSFILKFSVILMATFLLYGTYVSRETYQNILKNNYKNIDIMVDVDIESLRQTHELIRGTTFSLSGSDSIEGWRRDETFFSRGDKRSRLNQENLNKIMQKILTDNNVWNFELFDYVAIYENDQLLAFTYTKPYSAKQIITSSRIVYEQIKDMEDYTVELPPTEDDYTIYTTLRIKSDFKSAKALYIIGATNEQCFGERLNSLATYDGSLVFMTNKEGTVYSSNDSKWLGKELPKQLFVLPNSTVKSELVMNGTSYIVTKRTINKGYDLIYLYPKQEVVLSTFIGMRYFIMVSILFAAFIVVIFVLMTNGVKRLVKSAYESKILLDEMEIKFLQHQMNPHFLFNILLTIQIKAKMSGDEKIYKMISSLSALLRAGIYKDARAIVSIKEELEYVEYYLWLQKERFDDRLNYSIDILDASILNCKIPRLIIEAMVENAIVHGIENMSEGAMVRVTLEYAIVNGKEEILIHVIDNGIGFNAAEVVSEKVGLENDGSIRRDKMGLNNTNQRLKLIYGEQYGLEIRSKENEGTDIKIHIPKKLMETENDKSNDS